MLKTNAHCGINNDNTPFGTDGLNVNTPCEIDANK